MNSILKCLLDIFEYNDNKKHHRTGLVHQLIDLLTTNDILSRRTRTPL